MFDRTDERGEGVFYFMLACARPARLPSSGPRPSANGSARRRSAVSVSRSMRDAAVGAALSAWTGGSACDVCAACTAVHATHLTTDAQHARGRQTVMKVSTRKRFKIRHECNVATLSQVFRMLISGEDKKNYQTCKEGPYYDRDRTNGSSLRLYIIFFPPLFLSATALSHSHGIN